MAAVVVEEEEEQEDERTEGRIVFYKYHREGGEGRGRAGVGLKREEI